MPPENLFMNRQFAMRSNKPMALLDHVKAASTMAPVSINAMPNAATIMPMFIPKIVPGNRSFHVAVGTLFIK